MILGWGMVGCRWHANIYEHSISPFAEISRADSRCEQAIGMEVALAGEMLHSSLVTCETCKVVPKKGCESQERWIVPGMIWVLHCPNSAKVGYNPFITLLSKLLWLEPKNDGLSERYLLIVSRKPHFQHPNCRMQSNTPQKKDHPWKETGPDKGAGIHLPKDAGAHSRKKCD